jgi:hypothetical protein
MRYLSVHNSVFALTDEDAEILDKADIIYPCGDPDHDHDFHLNPELKFKLGIVEDLFEAIYRGRLADAPTLADAGVETIKMEGVIARNVALPMSGDALEKRIKFMQRNLALNATTTALARGWIGTSNKGRADEGEDVSVSLTVIPPGKHATFAWMAKKWVIGLISKMPGVDDQRKEEIIALIKDA